MNNLHPVSRTALVTGSGRNIGRSIAVAIGEQGHNVVINGSEDRVACEAVAAEVEQAGGQRRGQRQHRWRLPQPR
jgi:3-oxoacyl-[acyl-carrier protein] reductase